MTLAYPKDRHARTQAPKEYKDYKSYKPYLRLEFARRCVYCRTPDVWRGQASFGTDHYKPQVIFPELKNIYTNLFYCCNQCNSRKSNFWPANGEADAKFIPNPCAHRMFEHLRFSDGSVQARTTAGDFTVEHLDLNDPSVVGYRRTMMHMLEVQTASLNRSREQLTVLEGKYAEGKVSLEQYGRMKAKIQARCLEGENAVALLSGEDPPHNVP